MIAALTVHVCAAGAGAAVGRGRCQRTAAASHDPQRDQTSRCELTSTFNSANSPHCQPTHVPSACVCLVIATQRRARREQIRAFQDAQREAAAASAAAAAAAHARLNELDPYEEDMQVLLEREAAESSDHDDDSSETAPTPSPPPVVSNCIHAAHSTRASHGRLLTVSLCVCVHLTTVTAPAQSVWTAGLHAWRSRRIVVRSRAMRSSSSSSSRCRHTNRSCSLQWHHPQEA